VIKNLIYALKPAACFEPATFNDCSHSAKRKDAASVVWYDHLLARNSTAPLLMASGTGNHFEPAAAQDCDDLL
jgi:hypothetical protein